MNVEYNRDDIYTGDIFWLEYHGINVFFEVGRVGADFACVYELRTKCIKKDGKVFDAICLGRKGTKYPLFVPADENTWTKTNYVVETTTLSDAPFLVIYVDFGSKIYNLAKSYGILRPATGRLYAEKLDEDIYNFIFNRIQPEEPEIKVA